MARSHQIPEECEEMTDLKPCPFCGSGWIGILIGRNMHTYRIVCEACGGMIGFDDDSCPDPPTGSILDYLVEGWNRRVKE